MKQVIGNFGKVSTEIFGGISREPLVGTPPKRVSEALLRGSYGGMQ